MKRNIIIGIIAVILLVYAVLNPIVMGLLSLAGWIYLVVEGLKKGVRIFSRFKADSANKRFRLFKTLMVIGGISLVLGVSGILIHNLAFGNAEEPVTFFIGIIGLWIFIIATLASLLLFVDARMKAGNGSGD